MWARVLDDVASIEAPAVFGDDLGPVQDADLIECRDDGERPADPVVRDRVVVQVEPDVGALLRLDLDAIERRERRRRKREQRAASPPGTRPQTVFVSSSGQARAIAGPLQNARAFSFSSSSVRQVERLEERGP